MKSKKIFYILTLIVLVLWIVLSFMPNNCVNERFGPSGFLHWDVCDDMTFAENTFYNVLGVVTLLGSVYLIIMSLFYMKAEV